MVLVGMFQPCRSLEIWPLFWLLMFFCSALYYFALLVPHGPVRICMGLFKGPLLILCSYFFSEILLHFWFHPGNKIQVFHALSFSTFLSSAWLSIPSSEIHSLCTHPILSEFHPIEISTACILPPGFLPNFYLSLESPILSQRVGFLKTQSRKACFLSFQGSFLPWEDRSEWFSLNRRSAFGDKDRLMFRFQSIILVHLLPTANHRV